MMQKQQGSKVKSPSEIDIIVGRNIRSIRRKKNMTQVDLGHRMNLAFQQIQKYERGLNRIASGRLPKLAKVLECDINEFFEGVEVCFDKPFPKQRKKGQSTLKLNRARHQLIKQVETLQSLETIEAINVILSAGESQKKTLQAL